MRPHWPQSGIPGLVEADGKLEMEVEGGDDAELETTDEVGLEFGSGFMMGKTEGSPPRSVLAADG